MSVGDVNSVDHTGSVDTSTGDLHASNPALAAQFQAHLRWARQNMTVGPRYAFNNAQSNQTGTDASPRFNFQQPGPQTNKSPLPTNTLGRWTITPGAGGLLGLFGSELGLFGAAFQQLGHMQHRIEIAPVLTLDGNQFDRDAVKNEIMNHLPPLTAGGNVSDLHASSPLEQTRQENPATATTLKAWRFEAVRNRNSSTVCLRT